MLEDTPTRALVVVAHPDDPEFACGGTVALWTSKGCDVAYVIATDGSRGSDDETMTPDRLVALRREEQLEAARALGVQDVVFLGHTDGELSPSLELRHAIAREIRKWRPEVVITFDPARLYWDGYVSHPDHRFIGEATLYAVFPTARDRLNAPHLLTEGLEPHKVQRLLLVGALEPDTWIDIGPTIEKKIEALSQHVSQIRDPGALGERVRERAKAIAEGHGMEFAESFKQIAFYR